MIDYGDRLHGVRFFFISLSFNNESYFKVRVACQKLELEIHIFYHFKLEIRVSLKLYIFIKLTDM